MAVTTPLTVDQWETKLYNILPPWYFEKEDIQVAHVRALAKVLATLDQDAQDHFLETFIAESDGEFLDNHGAERTIERFTDELDPQYQVRVRNMRNQSNCPAIKKVVDQFLIVGECLILEDYNAAIFFDREDFLNRSQFLIVEIYNVFNIIVEKQLHEPYSFLDRGYFAGREDFIGTNESSDYVFQLITEAVNDIKAESFMYRVIERLES